jgi:FNIP Repeat
MSQHPCAHCGRAAGAREVGGQRRAFCNQSCQLALVAGGDELKRLRKTGLDWEDVRESENYGNFLKLPKDQFRNRFKSKKSQIKNAHLLLEADSGQAWHGRVPKGVPLYHGGSPLDISKNVPFFVSLSRNSAEKYGPVTVYQIETANLNVDWILWDQLAANYGFDVDLSQYEDWEALDFDIDSGTFSETKHAAEHMAHSILIDAEKTWESPLVIGSYEDQEFGFFPTAQQFLVPYIENIGRQLLSKMCLIGGKRGREKDNLEHTPIVTLGRDILRKIADQIGFDVLKELSTKNKTLRVVWKYLTARNYWWRMPITQDEFDSVVDSLIDPNNDTTAFFNVIVTSHAQVTWLRRKGLWEGVRNLRVEFDEFIDLPNNLLSVAFYGPFDQYVDIPEGIQSVTFGYAFDHLVELPPGVKYVVFGESFNQPLELPEGLVELTFGLTFEHPLVFPASFQKLTYSTYSSWGRYNRVPTTIQVVRGNV